MNEPRMSDSLKRGLLAWGSGVATMLIAVAIRDKGWTAVDAWHVMGAFGACGMFVSAVAQDN